MRKQMQTRWAKPHILEREFLYGWPNLQADIFYLYSDCSLGEMSTKIDARYLLIS